MSDDENPYEKQEDWRYERTFGQQPVSTRQTAFLLLSDNRPKHIILRKS